MIKEIKQQEIKSKLLRGKAYPVIAQETQLSLSTIKRYSQEIKQDFKELAKQGNNPQLIEGLLYEAIEVFDQAKQDLGELKQHTDNDSVRLGVINANVRLINDKIAILQQLNILPKAPEFIGLQVSTTQAYDMITLNKYTEFLEKNELTKKEENDL